MEELKLHQDNMSDMLTEKNGKQSSTKRTNHIRVQYLFIKNRIEKGYLSLKYFPTGEMYVYFFTKALQGETLRKFGAMIHEIPDTTPDVDMSCPRSMSKFTSQKCVG